MYPNIVDLSDIFNEKPTIKDLNDYLKNTIGNETVTFDKKNKIVIPQNGKKRKHIVDSSRYKRLHSPRHVDELERHNTYVISAEELIEHATYDSFAPNTKQQKKPDVLNYYYFDVPIYINGHGWNIRIDAEELKNSVARPQNKSAVRALNAATSNNTITLGNLQALNLYDLIEVYHLPKTEGRIRFKNSFFKSLSVIS